MEKEKNKPIDQDVTGGAVAPAEGEPIPQKPISNPLVMEQAVEKQEWWLIEVWKEKRDVFKALVEHILVFALLIGALVLFHFIFELLNLPQEHKDIIETVDFWSIVVALIIFGISFLYRLIVIEVRAARRKDEAEILLRYQMRRILSEEVGISGKELEIFLQQQLNRMKKPENR